MCGFLTLVDPSKNTPLQKILSTLNFLIHRGPDSGDYIALNFDRPANERDENPHIFMGHRRLSILDLSAAGAQPMRCRNTGNFLVFNGEIYNFLELKADLIKLGRSFETNTDTEVILQAYAEYGNAAFSKFNGMWAISIYDSIQKKLVLCRDRLGVKPLYFSNKGDKFVFCSEINPIRFLLNSGQSPNPSAVYDYLLLGLTDASESTLFEGISQIPPGGLWEIDIAGRLKKDMFHRWNIDPVDRCENPEVLRDLLIDSTLLRLRSDAPTATLLSGGVDSSIITWICANYRDKSQRINFDGAFTYGYEGAGFGEHDETNLASNFIKTFRSPIKHQIHLSKVVPKEKELFELIKVLEEPPSTPSTLAGLRLYKEIKKSGIKVVLTGEGADELFGGYTKNYISRMARDAIVSKNFVFASQLLSSPYINFKLVLNRLSWDLPPQILGPMLRNLRPNAGSISNQLWRENSERFEELCIDRRLSISERLYQDVVSTNLPMILRWTDRNSMHSGVEARSPFLDYRIVSHALKLNVRSKMGPAGGKLYLRQAFNGLLPNEILWRQKTHGFGNAEQFQIPRLMLERVWDELPYWASEYLDIDFLKRELKRPHSHTTLWLPLALLIWICVSFK
jgi:asparagine synthase (glutamine-hydrolysing)